MSSAGRRVGKEERKGGGKKRGREGRGTGGGKEARGERKIRKGRERERKKGNDRGTILNAVYISLFSTEPVSVFTLPYCIVAYSVV